MILRYQIPCVCGSRCNEQLPLLSGQAPGDSAHEIPIVLVELNS